MPTSCDVFVTQESPDAMLSLLQETATGTKFALLGSKRTQSFYDEVLSIVIWGER